MRWIKGLEKIGNGAFLCETLPFSFGLFKHSNAIERCRYWLSHIPSNHLCLPSCNFTCLTLCVFFSRPYHFQCYLLFILRTYASTLCLLLSSEQTKRNHIIFDEMISILTLFGSFVLRSLFLFFVVAFLFQCQREAIVVTWNGIKRKPWTW